jgi:hypothetical protein
LKKVKKFKDFVFYILILVCLSLIIYILVKPKPEIESTTVVDPIAIREISKLATLEFQYSDIIDIVEEEEFKLFGLWDIDRGEHILIAKYQGIIKLGIDFEDIEINEHPETEDGKVKLDITMPEVEVISSETPFETFEIITNRGIYTKEKVGTEVFIEKIKTQQEIIKADALKGDVAKLALENAKKQVEAFIHSLSDKYEIVWIN